MEMTETLKNRREQRQETETRGHAVGNVSVHTDSVWLRAVCDCVCVFLYVFNVSLCMCEQAANIDFFKPATTFSLSLSSVSR